MAKHIIRMFSAVGIGNPKYCAEYRNHHQSQGTCVTLVIQAQFIILKMLLKFINGPSVS